MIEAGFSQRKTARYLGVSHTIIQRDVADKLPKSGNKVATPTLTPEQRREAALREVYFTSARSPTKARSGRAVNSASY